MAETPPFVPENFLSATASARWLYHEFAEPKPMLDYRCHLSPRDTAEYFRRVSHNLIARDVENRKMPNDEVLPVQ